jgi:hypothetical protein
MGFPVVFEHMDACGVSQGRKVKVPAITAAAVILVSGGADQILMPAPDNYEYERVAEGIERLPKERRSLVKVIDKHGDILRRVRAYLEPLVAQAKKWPEDAFVGFVEDFLYQVALGTDFKAGILGHAVGTVREFIPIIDSQSFRGDAKFRLAEIASLICSYEPDLTDHGAYRLDRARTSESASHIWELVENAEFRAVVAASGRIGYLKHPRVALRRLRNAARNFLAKPEAAKLFTLATTTADFAGAKSIVEKARSIVELIGASNSRSFCPPFMDLGPAQVGVYRVALADAFADAIPPHGTIFTFEHSRGGRFSHSWLNVGEEMKLQREQEEIQGRAEKLLEARSALMRFI